MTTPETPTSIRRLESDEGARLARLVAAYDDVQTVLRCCERLVTLLERKDAEVDDLQVESQWTLALLCYARLFGDAPGGASLTEDDVVASVEGEEAEAAARQTHRLLLHLRDHHADATNNPRETYTAGVALDDDGAVNAVAVSSIRAPMLDVAGACRPGAIVYPLVALLDERIEAQQSVILETMQTVPKSDLEALERIEVAATGG